MPYRLGNKNVTQEQFLEYLMTSRNHMTQACYAGAMALRDIGVKPEHADHLATCIETILCSGIDMEMAQIQDESPELNSPVDMKEFMALQEQIAVLESQLEELKTGELSAAPEVRPGLAGMRMFFENQLRSLHERRQWMQEELEKFEAHAPTLNAAPEEV